MSRRRSNEAEDLALALSSLDETSDAEVRAPLSRAEKLAISAAVSPAIRANVARTSKRTVKVEDAAGNVVRYVTLTEIQAGLVARHALEIEVQPDEKPDEVMCEKCGLPMPAKKGPGGGKARKNTCDKCRGVASSCADCPARPPKRAFRTYAVESRGGAPWRCKRCTHRLLSQDPGIRKKKSEAAKLAWSDPKNKESFARSMSEACQSEEVKIRKSQAMKKKHALEPGFNRRTCKMNAERREARAQAALKVRAALFPFVAPQPEGEQQ